jgi:hypothetical protein
MIKMRETDRHGGGEEKRYGHDPREIIIPSVSDEKTTRLHQELFPVYD